MIILKQGEPRRNPVGRHQCPKCGALFELLLSDLDSLTWDDNRRKGAA